MSASNRPTSAIKPTHRNLLDDEIPASPPITPRSPRPKKYATRRKGKLHTAAEENETKVPTPSTPSASSPTHYRRRASSVPSSNRHSTPDARPSPISPRTLLASFINLSHAQGRSIPTSAPSNTSTSLPSFDISPWEGLATWFLRHVFFFDPTPDAYLIRRLGVEELCVCQRQRKADFWTGMQAGLLAFVLVCGVVQALVAMNRPGVLVRFFNYL